MTTTPPPGPTRTPRGFGIDPRLGAAALRAQAVSKEDSRPQVILKFHHPSRLDYRARHRLPENLSRFLGICLTSEVGIGNTSWRNPPNRYCYQRICMRGKSIDGIIFNRQGWRKVEDNGVALILFFLKSGVAPGGTI